MPIEHSPTKLDTPKAESTQPVRRSSPSMSNDQLASGGGSSPPSVIGATTLAKLPPFWKENPILWFAQIEAAFSIARITNDDMKFRYVVLNLDNTALPFVSDIVASPPLENKYRALKDRIINSFDETTESKLRKLIRGHEVGDDKPSKILHRLRNLAAGQCNDSILRTLFFEQLLENIRSVLAISEVTDLAILATQADKIYEISKPTSSALACIDQPSTAHDNPKDPIDVLTKRVDALTKELRGLRKRSRSRSRDPKGRPTSGNRNTDKDLICWYHRQFSERAKKCLQPCGFHTDKKQEN